MIARGIGAGRCQISPVRMPEAISGPLLRILLYEHYHGDTRITETHGKTGKLENPFATELRSYGVPTEKTFFIVCSAPTVEPVELSRTKQKNCFTSWVLRNSAAPQLRGEGFFLSLL